MSAACFLIHFHSLFSSAFLSFYLIRSDIFFPPLFRFSSLLLIIFLLILILLILLILLFSSLFSFFTLFCLDGLSIFFVSNRLLFFHSSFLSSFSSFLLLSFLFLFHFFSYFSLFSVYISNRYSGVVSNLFSFMNARIVFCS